MKEEEPDLACLRVAVDVDVVGQRVAGLRQLTVEGEVAAEQPVDAFALVEEVSPEPRDEQQIRLPRLDDDARCHTTVVEVPGTERLHIRLGDDAALLHATGLTLDGEGAVREEERRLGHANLTLVAGLFLEELAEDLGDVARRVRLELLTRQPDRCRARGDSASGRGRAIRGVREAWEPAAPPPKHEWDRAPAAPRAALPAPRP